MAKYYASEICNEVAQSLQIHGGYGFVRGFKIERLYKTAAYLPYMKVRARFSNMVIAGQIVGK